MKHKGILAIDFDETIADTKFPAILGLKSHAWEIINRLFMEGWYIIINTCRSGSHAAEAAAFLHSHNVRFHQINENHPDLITYFVYDCRKIAADIYIDDKNIDQIGKPFNWMETYVKVRRAEGKFEPMLDKFTINENYVAEKKAKESHSRNRSFIEQYFRYNYDGPRQAEGE